MENESKRLKRNYLYKRFLGFFLNLLICIGVLPLLKKVEIEEPHVLMLCKIVMDCSVICCFVQLIGFLVVCNGEKFIRHDRFLTGFRWKLHMLEIISIAGLLELVLHHKNQCSLRIDILAFIVFFGILMIEDDFYLNQLKSIEITEKASRAFQEYVDWYNSVLTDIDRFNEKENQLAGMRVAYAKDKKQMQRGEREKRSFVIGSDLHPDRFELPKQPEITRGFSGKSNVSIYDWKVRSYIDSLSGACQRSESSMKELHMMEEDADNIMRYIQGSEDDRRFEQVTGQVIDRKEKADKSYKLFKRKRFSKKRRTF